MEAKEKLVSLFQYIDEVNSFKRKKIVNIRDHEWSKRFEDMPLDNPDVLVGEADSHDEDLDVILSVVKPETIPVPEPDDSFVDWLEYGWEYYDEEVVVKDTLDSDYDDDEEVEHFEDDPKRVAKYKAWLELRNKWAEEEAECAEAREFFSELYNVYHTLQRDIETTELVVGSGRLFDRDRTVDHPFLLRAVTLKFDPETNELLLCNTDTESELYTVLVNSLNDIETATPNALQQIMDKLRESDYNPLDEEETPDFLRASIQQLYANGAFLEDGAIIPKNSQDKVFMQRQPVLFLRKKVDGLPEFIGKAQATIQAADELPSTMLTIVGEQTEHTVELDAPRSFEDQLAEIGGEDTNILLAKEANKEQLEIARKIEKYDAVVVQGPPGTGKTHTIANLMGHFLAQGKRVLVTSYTSKALSVLKDKLPPALQDLCVAVLDDDRKDTERSITGITDRMSNNTSGELLKKTEEARRARQEITEALADVRRRIYTIKSKEFHPLTYIGESVSPSEAARFVKDNEGKLDYIPGPIQPNHPLPLSIEELTTLYQTNATLSTDDEEELGRNVPNPETLVNPSKYKELLAEQASTLGEINSLAQEISMNVAVADDNQSLTLKRDKQQIVLQEAEAGAIEEAQNQVASFLVLDKEWMRRVAMDGVKAGSIRKNWELLVDSINKTSTYSEEVTALVFGKDVQIDGDIAPLLPVVEKMRDKYAESGKLGFFTKMFNSDFNTVEAMVTINGRHIASAEDCDILLAMAKLQNLRAECAHGWDSLMCGLQVSSFEELDANNPETIAHRYANGITRCLDWYEQEFKPFSDTLEAAGLPTHSILVRDEEDSDNEAFEKISNIIADEVPVLLQINSALLSYTAVSNQLASMRNTMDSLLSWDSDLCADLRRAYEAVDTEAYEKAYTKLAELYSKNAVRIKREELLAKLGTTAPQWAAAIRRREGIHGNGEMPETVSDAWRWKQYSDMLADMTKDSFEALQDKSAALSKDYRELTMREAENSAWYHLLARTEADSQQQQYLQGWMQTTKKIGKGTGKKAPKLRREARKLMVKCQSAVPAWIMPIGTAVKTLVPGETEFDVLIVDEASQADITALPLLTLAKKTIIVGDDKQVSPTSMIPDDMLDTANSTYIKGKIPNSHLYTLSTSIYDIAQQVSQPLMLREHFRCVPDIIEYCNELSYDNRIKPLRDTSDCKLLPSVVSYRVDGHREDKKKLNYAEAEMIAALMKACIDLPEYEDKTFGVVSLLGGEQADLVHQILSDRLGAAILEKRRVLCGDAANFQGDERDVIFLTMVDSNEKDGPLSLVSEGAGETRKKRYNVAVSRAKDQLWIVNSLDTGKDLKPNDLRKGLLDYAANYSTKRRLLNEATAHAESPFEESVAHTLIEKGYNLVQQWPVGAYRIDMVAVDGIQKVAIECDGERWHSGDDKVREDMERQTILERLGWRFVRIRGSEYYRDPEGTMERVMERIGQLGVEPNSAVVAQPENSELLDEVKRKAIAYIDEWHSKSEDQTIED